MMNKLQKVIHNPRILGKSLLLRTACFWKNDALYLKLLFYFKVGHRLNLKDPKTFSEKLQWLKLYNRRPEYIKMVDKVEAKAYVKPIIGEEHIIPTLGVYNTFDEIDFDKLPNQFVLKCTHDSGGIAICKDKASFDYAKAKQKLEKSLKKNYYWQNREWPYKNLKPRIIAEIYMVDESGKELKDYKFFCFNGVPTLCQVISDRFTEEKIDFFDMNWDRMVGMVGLNTNVSNSTYSIPCPKTFETMKGIVSKLSKDMPFSRIDLYEINGMCYFGEITFFPAAGMGFFRPDEWNYKLGELIQLR